MKYNQPYGVTDTNAAYINGDPTTGTMGSIPPAASIEFPQREIVAAISSGGLTPDNADLTQLAKALSKIDVSNVLKSSTNHGTQTAWAATVPPLPSGSAIPTGTALWFCPGQASVTGGTTFTVNGSTPAAVTLPDRSSLMAHDVSSAYSWLLMLFDGVVWQVLAGISRAPGQMVSLFANANWYVSAVNGSDTAYDGTQPAISGAHGPFATIQRAVNECAKYNMNGYSQYISVADYTTGGSYAKANLPPTNGAGVVVIQGNVNTPANCPVKATGALEAAFYQYGGQYQLQGFRVSTVAPAQDGVAVVAGQLQIVGNMQFGPCGRHHMASGRGGTLLITGTSTTIFIEAGATASSHLSAETSSNSNIDFNALPKLNVLGPVTLANFFASTYAASIQGYYAPITGFGNVTATKYSVSMNGLIGTLGQGPASIPGATAGVSSTGGQYQN